MNVTESKARSACPMNEMVWKQEYQEEKVTFATTAIILNIPSSPATIVMNVLVIISVKTRPSLQSKYKILLAVWLEQTSVSRSRFTAKLHRGADLCRKRLTSVGILPIPQADQFCSFNSYFCVCVSSDTDQYRTVCSYEVYISLYNNCYRTSLKSSCGWFLGLCIFPRYFATSF